MFEVRTDLAVEENERITKAQEETKGISVTEEDYGEEQIHITTVRITTENGAKQMGKPKGTYITLEAAEMIEDDEDYHREISQALAHHLKELLHLEKEKSILVVGLGNREITPDALGPQVIQNLKITRHIIKEYGKAGMGKRKAHQISSLVPGVMAQTGMETAVIVRGIVASSRPDVVIAIDALAARSSARLNTTVQLSDRGINPGSGVGNHRMGLTRESVGVPVIAVGIPTVIEAATIVHDAIVNFTKAFAGSDIMGTMNDVMDSMTEKERRALMLELIAPSMSTMYVTPRDVDAAVQRTAYIVARALDRLPDIMTTV